MPAIFGDHMVLQEESRLPVWGWGSPGEKIIVTFKNQKQRTTAAADGTWRVDMSKINSGCEENRFGILVILDNDANAASVHFSAAC